MKIIRNKHITRAILIISSCQVQTITINVFTVLSKLPTLKVKFIIFRLDRKHYPINERLYVDR